MAEAKAKAEAYLTSLLNKSLRINTTDDRMFIGQFRCTDADSNIILSSTHEYRFPNPTPPSSPRPSVAGRYVGLVVVPGQYITKIEVEEFTSQAKDRARNRLAGPGAKTHTEIRTESTVV